MKTVFYGYYPPSKEEFTDLWENCLFVFDANVLLNLYRYSSEASEALIGILEKISISDRLWIPHQAALEYQENRLGVIGQQVQVYEKVSKTLQQTLEDLEALLGRGHLSIDAGHLLKKLEDTFTEVEKELEERKQQHPDLFRDDNIRDIITSIFEGAVGPPCSQESLPKFYEMGKKRYEGQVPPGYRDRGKKELKRYGNLMLEEQYGDLILWFQIIEKAKETQKPIIFVTDDIKLTPLSRPRTLKNK